MLNKKITPSKQIENGWDLISLKTSFTVHNITQVMKLGNIFFQ
jgi:hypothetical protein